jgi:hypothetical protein
MNARRTLLALPALPALLLAGCTSTPAPPPDPAPAAAPASAPADPYREYLDVADGEALGSLLQRDLDQGRSDRAFEGLRRLVMTSLVDGRATHASLAFDAAQPVLRFQAFGGLQHVNAIKPLPEMLREGAARELARLHDALRHGDAEAVRRMRAEPRRLLHPETVRRSSALVPHAELAEAFLAFCALRDAAAPEMESGLAIVARVDAAAPALAEGGWDEQGFLAHVIAAQTLERVGLAEAALERWIEVGRHAYLPSASEGVRLAVAGRIQSYRDRLRDEMTARIRAEESTRAAEEIRRLEARHAEFDQEQKARLAVLETELASARGAMRAEADAELARQRGWYEGRLEDQIRYTDELQRTLLRIAEDGTPTAAGALGDGTGAGAVREGVALLADVLSIYQSTGG